VLGWATGPQYDRREEVRVGGSVRREHEQAAAPPEAADELVADGDAEGGARMLLDLLRERAALYAERYRDAIVS
jgi:hypothetical protein